MLESNCLDYVLTKENLGPYFMLTHIFYHASKTYVWNFAGIPAKIFLKTKIEKDMVLKAGEIKWWNRWKKYRLN